VVNLAFLVLLQAKPGKEEAAAAFLKSALPLVEAEPGTTAWFGFQIGKSTFGIFDEPARQAHLHGKVADALIARAPELFESAPDIQHANLLASKFHS
jgi:quinol monooxygenase YgiN